MLFTRYKNNPVITPDSKKSYEAVGTFNPAAAVHNDKMYIIYRALNKKNCSSLCLAVSKDGFNFKKYKKNPIIKPSFKERSGVEDPRVTKIGDTYYLLYTSYNGKQPVTAKTINECLATSKDMVHWKKRGVIMKGEKSAALHPEKVNGRYLVFIGGASIRVATAKKLKKLKLAQEPILATRDDHFDSVYVEVGPPSFTFKNKIVLFFNTTNKNKLFQPSLALLDKKNPHKVLYRANKPLMKPIKPYEKEGIVNNVIFATGLVEWKDRYFLYYGGADTTINLATVTKKKMEKYLAAL
tara:strand:+ start:6153 stop:7040 length:888 start_codon:yes stop_codon:yes gene_type:complete